MKKIILVTLLLILNIVFLDTSFWAWDKNAIQEALIWTSETDALEWSGWTEIWTDLLASLLKWVKDSLQSLILVVAIWVFLYIWARLAFARWNQEEYKKAMLHLVYAIIWIFVVAIAWAAVTMVAWINF